MLITLCLQLWESSLRLVSYPDLVKLYWKELLKVPFSVWLRWGPDGVRFSRRHAGPSSGRGGHPAAGVVPPDPGLPGLPFLRRHRLRHLRRRHGVGLDDGRGHGALRALHQKEGREPGHGRGGGRARRDGTLLPGQEWPWQRGFENVTYCLNDLCALCTPWDSRSASCHFPELSAAWWHFSPNESVQELSSERDVRWTFTLFFFSFLQFSVFSGDVTAIPAAIVEVCCHFFLIFFFWTDLATDPFHRMTGKPVLATLTSPASAACQPVHEELPPVCQSVRQTRS